MSNEQPKQYPDPEAIRQKRIAESPYHSDFARERIRQKREEGWTEEHDDQHESGELLRAAVLYYHHAVGFDGLTLRADGAPTGWPWEREWWKPKTPVLDLIRSGALALAELDRLLRHDPQASCEHVHHKLRLIDAAYRAELSRLRNEEPKRGDAAKETDGQLLARLGDDASKWAAEFRQTAIRLGYSDMDEGWLIGWFANAIEHSSQVRSPSPSPEPQDVREALLAAQRTLAAYQKQGAPHAFVGDISLQKVHALIDAALAQSDAQPVGVRKALRHMASQKLSDELEPDEKSQADFEGGYNEFVRRARRELGQLYTAPPRPDASGLIEAAEVLRIVDEALDDAKEIATRDPEAGTIAIWLEGVRKHIDQLRSRAADRSAPKGGQHG